MIWGDDTLPVASDADLARAAPLRDPKGAADAAAFGFAQDTGPTALLWRAGRALARGMDDLGYMATGDVRTFADAARDRQLTAEEANARFGVEGALTFDAPVTESRAAELWDIKQTELLRQDTLARSSVTKGAGGFLRTLGFSLAGGLADPVMLGVGFLPLSGLGLLRAGGLAAAAESPALGVRLAGGAGLGAIEGALGAAALEPVVYPLAALREKRDYSAWDSLLNVAGGALFGGIGGVLAHLRGPAAAEEAFAHAVGAVADGQPVDVAGAAGNAAAGLENGLQGLVEASLADVAHVRGRGAPVELDDALPGGIEPYLRGVDEAGRAVDADAASLARTQISLALKAERAFDAPEALARYRAAIELIADPRSHLRQRAERRMAALEEKLVHYPDRAGAVETRAAGIVEAIVTRFDAVRGLGAGDDGGLGGVGGGFELSLGPPNQPQQGQQPTATSEGGHGSAAVDVGNRSPGGGAGDLSPADPGVDAGRAGPGDGADGAGAGRSAGGADRGRGDGGGRTPAPAPADLTERFSVRDELNGQVAIVSDAAELRATARPDEGWLQIDSVGVKPERRGEGRGVAVYEAAIAEAQRRGLALASDTSISPDAMRVWQALERRGYAIETNPNLKTSEHFTHAADGAPVFVVRESPAAPEAAPSPDAGAATTPPDVRPRDAIPDAVTDAGVDPRLFAVDPALKSLADDLASAHDDVRLAATQGLIDPAEAAAALAPGEAPAKAAARYELARAAAFCLRNA